MVNFMVNFLVKLTNKSKNIFFIILLLIINLVINKTLFAYINNNHNNNSTRIINNSKNKISNKISNNKTCDKTKTCDLNIKFDPKIKCPKDVSKLTKLHLMGGQYLQKNPTDNDLKEINKIAKFAVLNNKILSNNINKNKNKNNTIYYGCVTTQVVAGINYTFTILYDKNYYRATVWKQLDNKYQLSEFKKIQY
jgi:hypothetical protein